MNRIADRQREAEHVEIPVVGQQHARRSSTGSAAVRVIVTRGPSASKAVRDRINDEWS